jgi:tripartite-type tricarboxylate transporter receptor subunit TctC
VNITQRQALERDARCADTRRAGFSGFLGARLVGVFAPAGTPKPIIDKLNAEFAKVINQPELKKQLTEQLGMDLVASSPEALQEWTVREIARWGKVVKDNGIKPD